MDAKLNRTLVFSLSQSTIDDIKKTGCSISELIGYVITSGCYFKDSLTKEYPDIIVDLDGERSPELKSKEDFMSWLEQRETEPKRTSDIRKA